MSRVSSKLNFDSNQPNPLIDEALERLDLNQIDLSRQTSINNSTVKSSNYQPNTAMKQFKSAN